MINFLKICLIFVEKSAAKKKLVNQESITFPCGSKKNFVRTKKRQTLMDFQMEKKWEKVGENETCF